MVGFTDGASALRKIPRVNAASEGKDWNRSRHAPNGRGCDRLFRTSSASCEGKRGEKQMILHTHIARACFFGVILAAAAQAANLQEAKKACLQRASLTAGKHWLEECVIDVITLRPVHPVFRSL